MTKLILLIISLATAFEFPGTGRILGTVRNAESEELLPKTRLIFSKVGADSVSTSIETSSGNFGIVDVPWGEYTCTVIHPGYRTLRVGNIQVHSSGATQIDFLLRPAKTASDSGSLDIFGGKVGSEYRMKFYMPEDTEYR